MRESLTRLYGLLLCPLCGEVRCSLLLFLYFLFYYLKENECRLYARTCMHTYRKNKSERERHRRPVANLHNSHLFSLHPLIIKCKTKQNKKNSFRFFSHFLATERTKTNPKKSAFRSTRNIGILCSFILHVMYRRALCRFSRMSRYVFFFVCCG